MMPKKPKGYTLRLFATGAGESSIADLTTTKTSRPAAGPVDLTHRAKDWIWSKVRKGGAWDGSFSLTGTFPELHQMMREWLAYRLEERAGIVTWQGLIWTMELSGVSIPRRVSMDDVWNAIRCEYREHLSNTGFEEAGSGGNTFAGWVDNNGTISDETTKVARGGHAAKLLHDGSQFGQLIQDAEVVTNAEYRFSFYVRADSASTSAGFFIRDQDNAVNIIEGADGYDLVGTIRAQYRRVSVDFTIPAGCTTIRLNLTNISQTNAAYFDEASLVRLIDGKPDNSFTDFYTNDQSIARYGRKELTVNARDKTLAQAQTLAQTELKKRAWPRIQPTGFDTDQRADKPTLTIYAVGYIVTTLYRYAPVGNGYIRDAGVLAEEAITNNANFVSARNVATLGVKTRFSQDDPPRVFDLLQIVASEGGSSDGIIEIDVDKDRGISIKPMDKTKPRYYLRGGQIYDSPGAKHPVNARLVVPGLVKDMDYPGTDGFQDDIFDDSSLLIMEAIQVDENNKLTPMAITPSLRIDAEAR